MPLLCVCPSDRCHKRFFASSFNCADHPTVASRLQATVLSALGCAFSNAVVSFSVCSRMLTIPVLVVPLASRGTAQTTCSGYSEVRCRNLLRVLSLLQKSYDCVVRRVVASVVFCCWRTLSFCAGGAYMTGTQSEIAANDLWFAVLLP